MPDFTGTNAKDTLGASEATDTVSALGGSDQVDALGGDDTVSGGDGADTLHGGAGNDILYGHSVADLDPNSGHITATLLTQLPDDGSGNGAGALALAGAPGDDGFVYALRKNTGDIIRINTTTGAQSTFLDIPDDQFSTNSERGTVNLVFHPDYAANGRFFVYLTNTDGDIELREYARSGDPAVATATPVQTIITIEHSEFGNHNGGALAFGPDGNLYIGVGDGGGGDDPHGNAQNINVLLGKILRIDVDGDDFPADSTRNYAIPAGNPFAGATPGADEIWATGVRNPWRISFDPVTGDLYIGDVGQGAREEVDFDAAGGPGGLNYGWDFREGSIQRPGAPPAPPIAFTDPVFDYAHNGQGASITGGYVYRGPAPGLEGAYFFADFVTGRVFTLRMVDGKAEDAFDRTDQIVGANLNFITSFGTDNAGNLYVVTFGGAIYRLDPGAAAGDAADMIDGGIGDDSVFGGAGNDTLLGAAGNDVLTGGAGKDTMRGGAGDDTYVVIDSGDIVDEAIAGSGGIDTVQSSISFTLTSASSRGAIENLALAGIGDIDGTGSTIGNAIAGNAGRNVLSGLGGNDVLQGLGGDDTLDGGTGKDTLRGGAGNDSYVITGADDQIDEEANLDTGDAVRSMITVDLAALGGGAIEHATLLGAGALKAFGNGGANTLTGNKAANVLDGRGGADTLTGGDGGDTYVVDDDGDKVVETNVKAAGGIDLVQSAVTFALGANLEKLTLTGKGDIDATGNELNNSLVGNIGSNRLDGGAGKDAMAGGGGDDTYVVDSAGDVVTETAGNGTDTVESAITFSLATRVQVENLTLTGAAVNATGNALGNVLTGNALANILDGRAGNDTLRGGGGNDLYIVDKVGDVVDEESNTDTGDEVKSVTVLLAAIAGIEHYTFAGTKAWTFTGNGSDNRISGGSGADNLDGAGGNDTLLGNGGNDTLTGGIGADSLDGGTGNDLMKGGAGSDIYVVNAAGDKIDEEGNADAADLARASISVNLTTLGGGLIEDATLIGAAAINATGTVGINHLIGNDGANKLDGGGGADILEGGKGADTYDVDDIGDKAIETIGGAAGGIDLVRSTVSFTLGANVEKLTLLGSDDIDATGNTLNNTLLGNAGANILDGGAGNDAMTGGKGDDTYIVDAAGDTVIEAAGGGTDLVQSSVTFSLASRVNVENLELTGGGKITGTGNALANVITGNDGDNTLNGAAGNDTLTGGDGIDRLSGGTGRDTFDYNLVSDAGDTITDFTKGANGDVLDLHDILADAGFAGSDAFADGFLSFDPSGKNTVITVFDGGVGPGTAVATLLNVSLTQIDTANFLT
jgi:Ca2+-binding RTX toxin-like protein